MARPQDLGGWLRARDGIAHSSDLRAAGFSAHDMSDAVSRGTVRRLRRSWLALPECDPRRIAAASVGGRVTCVSAAAIWGVWVPPATPAGVHVAVPRSASRLATAGLHVHWSRGPAPAGRTQIDDPRINVLFHIARCLPRAEALSVWESAIRSRAIEADLLPHVAWRSTRAAQLAAVAGSLSDSGLETIFVDGMRRSGVRVRQQIWVDGHPLDGVIGRSLAIQIDGFAHHQAADRRRDLAADARLVMRGYVVLRFDYQQILFEWERVRDTVVTAMAQGLHTRTVTA